MRGSATGTHTKNPSGNEPVLVLRPPSSPFALLFMAVKEVGRIRKDGGVKVQEGHSNVDLSMGRGRGTAKGTSKSKSGEVVFCDLGRLPEWGIY